MGICCLLCWRGINGYFLSVLLSVIYLFLAHLSWKLKWAFLITRCPASVCLSVCLSDCKLLHFWLLLQNCWTNFNQTWHKSSLGEGIQVCSNEKDFPSPRGDNCGRIKIHWKFFKIFFSRTSGLNSNKLGTNYPWMKEFKFVQINGQVSSKGR